METDPLESSNHPGGLLRWLSDKKKKKKKKLPDPREKEMATHSSILAWEIS